MTNYTRASFTMPPKTSKWAAAYRELGGNFSELVCDALVPKLAEFFANREIIQECIEAVELEKQEIVQKCKLQVKKKDAQLAALNKVLSDMDEERAEIAKRELLQIAAGHACWYDNKKSFVCWIKDNPDILISAGFQNIDSAYAFITENRPLEDEENKMPGIRQWRLGQFLAEHESTDDLDKCKCECQSLHGATISMNADEMLHAAFSADGGPAYDK